MTDTYGQYKILERIAAGGMGEVFKARLVREGGFEKTLAIKRMLPTLCHSPGFEERFLAEARLAARLSHNNIVHIYDFGELSGTHFLAMEYIDGVDLGSLLKRLKENGERLPLSGALKIAADALRGLDYAHRLKNKDGRGLDLIHRDISPSNVLISFESEVKLTDFGLACVTDEGFVESDNIAGKLSYLPPESIRGETLDRRSDIYSLGLVMYEMVYGRQAFPAGIPENAIFKAIMAGAADFPEEENIPSGVEEIIRTASATEKADRFGTARAMLLAIEEALEQIRGRDDETLPKLLVRLFPDRAESRSAAPERTILSTRPISPTPKSSIDGLRKDEKDAEGAAPEKTTKAGRPLLAPALLLSAVLVFLGVMWFLPDTAELEIGSNPSGAEIWIDGKSTNQRTPTTLSGLAVDRPQRVKLTLRHHDPLEKEIILSQEEKNSLSADLVRSLQACRLETSPPGAAAWLNGKKIDGMTPVSMGELPLGPKQRLKIEKDNFVPFQTEFIIDKRVEGQKIFSYTLRSIYKELIVKVEPARASIYVDGKKLQGHSPYRVEGLVPNRKVRIVAGMKGYENIAKEILPGKDAGPIQFKLRQFSCNITLDGPEGSSIDLNGAPQGSRVNVRDAEKKAQLFTVRPSKGEGKLVIRAEMHQVRSRGGFYVAEAVLNFDAQPWGRISLDGGKPVSTPISGKKLNAGKHRIDFQFGGKGRKYRFSFQLF